MTDKKKNTLAPPPDLIKTFLASTEDKEERPSSQLPSYTPEPRPSDTQPFRFVIHDQTQKPQKPDLNRYALADTQGDDNPFSLSKPAPMESPVSQAKTETKEGLEAIPVPPQTSAPNGEEPSIQPEKDLLSIFGEKQAHAAMEDREDTRVEDNPLLNPGLLFSKRYGSDAEPEGELVGEAEGELLPLPQTDSWPADVSPENISYETLEAVRLEEDSEETQDEESPEEQAKPAWQIPLSKLVSIVESILFVSGKPMTVNLLANIITESRKKEIRQALAGIVERYREYQGGWRIVAVSGGFAARSNRENAEWVRRLLQVKPEKLSPETLVTLAIVAYRQPITRAEIDDIRGADSGNMIRRLLERRLIKIVGKKEIIGRPLLYGTTKEFLNFFGLTTLKDLPPVHEFQELTQEDRSRVQEKIRRVVGGTPVDYEELEAPEIHPEKTESAQKLEKAAEDLDQAMQVADSTLEEVMNRKFPDDEENEEPNDSSNGTQSETVMEETEAFEDEEDENEANEDGDEEEAIVDDDDEDDEEEAFVDDDDEDEDEDEEYAEEDDDDNENGESIDETVDGEEGPDPDVNENATIDLDGDERVPTWDDTGSHPDPFQSESPAEPGASQAVRVVQEQSETETETATADETRFFHQEPDNQPNGEEPREDAPIQPDEEHSQKPEASRSEARYTVDDWFVDGEDHENDKE